MRAAALGFLLATAAGGEIIDCVTAIVGREVITQSEVEREARLEEFLGGRRPAPGEVLERLIRQRLVFQEISQTVPPDVEQSEIREWLAATRRPGVQPESYGLRPADLEEYARRQLVMEKFIDLRFKTGLQVSDAEVAAYYEQRLLPELRRRGASEVPPLEAVRAQAEQGAIEERVSQMVDEWVAELRQRAGVRIVERSGG